MYCGTQARVVLCPDPTHGERYGTKARVVSCPDPTHGERYETKAEERRKKNLCNTQVQGVEVPSCVWLIIKWL